MELVVDIVENKYREINDDYAKGRFGIIDTRDGRVVVTSNSWFIVDELFLNGYDYYHTPYKVTRLY